MGKNDAKKPPVAGNKRARTAEPALKAYAVTELDEESAVVVFARGNAEARRIGAGQLNGDFDYVSCRRAHEFDDLSPGPVSPMQYIQRGWRWTCSGCEKWISEDSIRYENLKPVECGGDIYCSPWCRLSSIQHYRAQDGLKELARTVAAQALPYIPRDEMKGLLIREYRPRRDILGVEFKVPGGSGYANWRMDRPGTVEISRMDLDAWEIFRGRKEAKSKEPLSIVA